MSTLSGIEAQTTRGRSARLDDVLSIIRGVSYKKHDASSIPASNTVPVLRATNIQDGALDFDELVYVPRKYVSDEQLLRRGDIVVAASSGSRSVVGKAASLRDDWNGSFGAFCFGLRPKSGIDPDYLAWFLQTSEYRRQVSELAAGVNINNLRATHIQQIPIPVPAIEEQKQIVAEIEKQFTRLDAGVAALRRVQANLKRYRATVLKAACEGRLVPTEAELARAGGRSYETGEQLLARILADRRKNWQGRGKYKDPVDPDTTNLPPLPVGWIVASIDQIADETAIGLDRGRGQQSSDPSVGIPYIKMNNVTMDGNVHFDKLVYVPASLEERACFAVKDGDILFNTRNSKELVGKVGRVRTPPAGAIYNNNLMRIRLVAGIDSAFLTIQMCSHEFRRRMELVKKATTNVAAVYAKDLLPLAVVVPPRAEQTRIVAEVERRLSVIEELEAAVAANLQRATHLRQSILQRAFAGT
jgi:type I restriction enzyme S subunit